MNTSQLSAELSAKTIEFEMAMDRGAAHQDLIKIYRQMKELQYQLTLLESQQPRPVALDLIIE